MRSLSMVAGDAGGVGVGYVSDTFVGMNTAVTCSVG